MKKITRHLQNLCLILLFCSCASLYTSTDCNKDINFSKYTTFNVCSEDLKVENTAFPKYDNQFNRQLMKENVMAEMEKKGYQHDESNPQLQVGFRYAIEDEIVSLINCYDESEFGFNGLCTIEDYHYKEETLMVYVSDLKTNQIIWHAILSKELTSSPKKLKRALKKRISKLFKKYPI